LLGDAGIETGADDTRGFDHGVFVPLKLVFPDAGIPTTQLSLRRGLAPAEHLAVGRALASLRDDGVFIIGSGMSYHNMRAFNSDASRADSAAFDVWLTEAVQLDGPEREARLEAWTTAPRARECHPREEHLLPLMVCAGASRGDSGVAEFRDEVMGAVVSAYRFG
jgi:aromatic ring-opening dioxygenase catalytic subunit (LigB family)